MPSSVYDPPAALAGAFDARQWAGSVVFYRSATPAGDVTLPSTAGVYEDPFWFLNGRFRPGGGSTAQALGNMLAKACAAAGGGLALTAGIGANDRVYVQGDGPFSIAAAGAGCVLGFSTSTLNASAIGGGLYRAVAQGEWVRGPVVLDSASTSHLDMGDGLVTWDTTVYAGKFSSVVEWLRTTAANDADEPATLTDTLEYLDNDANGSAVGSLSSITWGIDEDGHVFSSWPSSTGIAAPTWVDTDFRDRLGFSGSESAVTVDGLTVLTADYPLPGLFVTVEPLLLPPRAIGVEDSTSVQMTDGSHGSTVWRTGRQFEVEFFVEGPASSLAQHRHYIDRCLPHWTAGRPLTIYPEWGDHRRRLDPLSVTSSVAAYSLLYTSQDHGERGRIRGYVAEGNPKSRALEWSIDRLRTRGRQSWVIDEATSG